MAAYEVSASEAEEVYEDAAARASEGQNPWPGMTYIEGVRDVLAWLFGDEESHPLSELEED